ncbi:hypothetical protein ABPG75_002071, partial [Micractinium tetrahymenae]
PPAAGVPGEDGRRDVNMNDAERAGEAQRICAKPGMEPFAAEEVRVRIYRSGLNRELQELLLLEQFPT